MIEKIRNILLEYVDAEPESITAETEFLKDLHMDSFTVMSMVGEMEDEFNVEIDVEDLTDIVTVQDLADYLSERM